MRLRTEAILSALQPRQDMSFREAKQLDTPSHAGPGQVFLPGCMKIFQGAGKICWSAEQRLLTFADPRRREDFGCIPGFSLGSAHPHSYLHAQCVGSDEFGHRAIGELLHGFRKFLYTANLGGLQGV